MLRLLLTGFLLWTVPAARGDGPPTSGVVRADELRETVRAFLADRLAARAGESEILFRSVPDSLRVARLPYTLRVSSGGSGRINGNVALVVEIEDAGRTVQRCMVTAVVRTWADVLVTERQLPRHTTPAAADVRRVRLETTAIERPLVLDPAALVSVRTTRIVPRGAVVYTDLLEPVPLVLQGERVQVQVRSGAVMLTAEGIAREDGARGDWIEVYLQGRSERVRARVLDAQTLALPVQ